MFHINDASYLQAAAKSKQSNEHREFINSQMLSKVQELFWKGQSKCLDYQLIQDSEFLVNNTEALLQLNLFNDDISQNGSYHENRAASSSCISCCKTKVNSHHPTFEKSDDTSQSAEIDMQAMNTKMTYLDAEINLMKLQLSEFSSIEIVQSQIEILSREQQKIVSRLRLFEQSMVQMQSTKSLDEIFYNDLEANITKKLGMVEEHLISIQGQMETKISKLDFEALENRLTVIESQLALSQKPTHSHSPTRNSNFDIYVYCLEFAQRIKEKRLNEYFNSDQNMTYFIFITCVDNKFF